MLPRFTEQGFDVVTVPPSVHAKLKKAVDEGVARWDDLREEQQVVRVNIINQLRRRINFY